MDVLGTQERPGKGLRSKESCLRAGMKRNLVYIGDEVESTFDHVGSGRAGCGIVDEVQVCVFKILSKKESTSKIIGQLVLTSYRSTS